MSDTKAHTVEITTDIVAAYLSNNPMPAGDIQSLIQQVHIAVVGMASGIRPVEAPPQAPAVSVRKSITPDHLICLEDGRKFKSLKRHLRSKYDLTPEQYRAKWNLPKNYPMVAPAYSEARSNLAKQIGLGKGGRRRKPATKSASGPAKPGS